MMGLPYGEEIMIVGRTMWTQSRSVTDRQTDRITSLRFSTSIPYDIKFNLALMWPAGGFV